jgi:hypothetical protein
MPLNGGGEFICMYINLVMMLGGEITNTGGIVFPFIIWFYGSAIVIIRGWSCGFGNSEDIVTWSDNRPSFTVLGFMAVVAYCRGI